MVGSSFWLVGVVVVADACAVEAAWAVEGSATRLLGQYSLVIRGFLGGGRVFRGKLMGHSASFGGTIGLVPPSPFGFGGLLLEG